MTLKYAPCNKYRIGLYIFSPSVKCINKTFNLKTY